MPFSVSLDSARAQFPQYTFVRALTPSAQKCAFHVRDANGQDLCLKLIAPDYEIERLQREILALQLVSHPNVATLLEYAFSSRGGTARHYVVEHFVAGHDLSEDLKAAPWKLARALEVFAQISDGLGALRLRAIVHRDLKPSNIRIASDGRPVIIDFGLSRHLSLPDLTATVEGARIGTPAYFAPEQFDGTKHDIDHRTDLWALGVLLYEATCGRHPFFAPGQSMQALRDAVCDGQDHLSLPAFQALPEKVRLILTKLLEKERQNRPFEAQQVAMILRKLQGGS